MLSASTRTLGGDWPERSSFGCAEGGRGRRQGRCLAGVKWAEPFPWRKPPLPAAALNSKEAEAAFAAGGGGKKAQAERLLADAKAAAAAKGKGGDGKAAAAAAAKPAAGMPDPRLRSAPRQEVNARCAQGVWLVVGLQAQDFAGTRLSHAG